MTVRYKVKGDHVVAIHKVVVHRFLQSDVDDPDIYAAETIYEWQQTPAGKFIMTNCLDAPEMHRMIDNMHVCWRYAIVAEIEEKKLSEYYLKFGVNDGKSI